MKTQDWAVFREQNPELAETILKIGAQLYEMGVDEARKSIQLQLLHERIAKASPEARALLGFTSIPDNARLLGAVVEWGSTLLLRYVKTGAC